MAIITLRILHRIVAADATNGCTVKPRSSDIPPSCPQAVYKPIAHAHKDFNMVVQKKLYVSDFQMGNRVDETFVLTEARQCQAKNGPYWQVRLQDARGELDGKIWSPVSRDYQELPVGVLVRVKGTMDQFRDQLQLRIDKLDILEVAPHEVDWALFAPRSRREPEALLQDIETLCRGEIRHDAWRAFCQSVLSDTEVRARLLHAPGAKSMHHAYIGGLLEHTLSVCRLCLAISAQYPRVDRDILLVAAVFHDLGKAWELGAGLQRDYTDPGRLLGHILLGLEILEPYLQAAPDISPGLKLHFKHLLASHHGEYAYGSPKLPQTPEAIILHYVDNLDAKVNMVSLLVDAIPENESWSPYQRSMERQFFRAETSPASSAPYPPAPYPPEPDCPLSAPESPFETAQEAAPKAAYGASDQADSAPQPEATPKADSKLPLEAPAQSGSEIVPERTSIIGPGDRTEVIAQNPPEMKPPPPPAARPKTTPETVTEAAPGTLSGAAPQRGPQARPETAAGTVSGTAPRIAPGTVSGAAPGTAPKTAPESRTDSTPQAPSLDKPRRLVRADNKPNGGKKPERVDKKERASFLSSLDDLPPPPER